MKGAFTLVGTVLVLLPLLFLYGAAEDPDMALRLRHQDGRRLQQNKPGHEGHEHGHDEHEHGHEEQQGHEGHEHGHEEHEHDHEHNIWTLRDAWVGSMVACAVMLVSTLLGIAVFYPLSKTACAAVYEMSMISLSAGLMLSESLVHLIPHAFERLFFHTKGGNMHTWMVWLGISAVAGALLVVIIEVIVDAVLHRNTDKLAEQESARTSAEDASQAAAEKSAQEQEQTEKQKKKKHVSLAIGNIIGEAMCLFVDGTVIGIAFLNSKVTGILASLAVWIHEAPQELGDFVILRRAGLSMWAAALVNFALGLFVAAGAVTILAAAGDDPNVHPYLMMAAAGVFIALTFFKLLPLVYSELKKAASMALAMRILSVVLFLGAIVGIYFLSDLEAQAHDHGNISGVEGEGTTGRGN
uniref:Uncharacterized protein n=1 Tax=Chromera velia CCMP2878 TaxID=1169474 RepID=A0A0G4H076_9ALVE|eukprot:Cvel_5473.t1-p1 / transcript=Cvel_5473.t1 / gene=Cvel_5473 / organism=Chromera_velia_CCMP2878 / gene_product=Zinc transporter ZIP12, putative / transcript_product=Zinc transporter ZIP12, putative / location=Cvel_scaffold256:12845-14342(+) / protein_length=410 / sequence_SO=supercontig / SO=protein_coding / is_pseudo=false